MTRLTRRTSLVPCTIDIAHTADTLHAHVELANTDIGPGDRVLVHGAPTSVRFGERVLCDRTATVTHAGWLARFWTRLTSRFEVTMLYEVSFSPCSARRRAIRRKQ